MRWRLPATAFVLATSCLEYSPHALPTDSSERDLHAKALEKLTAVPAPAVLRFAIVGDAHVAYDEAEDAIDRLNERDDLSFVVQVGDFTQVGILPEFRAMNRIFAHLRVPYFVAIGIHDEIGNGEEIYERMFGPPNLAFTYGRTRFVLLDTNSREVGFDGTVPDLAWLSAQLAPDDAHDRAVVFGHVPPGSSDFDPSLTDAYLRILRDASPVASIHGHEHRNHSEEWDGVPIYFVDRVEGRTFLVATLRPGGAFDVELERF